MSCSEMHALGYDSGDVHFAICSQCRTNSSREGKLSILEDTRDISILVNPLHEQSLTTQPHLRIFGGKRNVVAHCYESCGPRSRLDVVSLPSVFSIEDIFCSWRL
ncbi:hypothetical protein FRC19_011870 [Serendipita sp. 401]|nr:hypothetical protein FRC19_011870 [Serendipita sp. 401]KAG9052322.1 hypothetical protein FS842_010046 [Serendipita sp. 407]